MSLRESGVIQFDEAIARVPEDRQPLVEIGLSRVLDPWHKFYLLQKQQGLWPAVTDEKILVAATRDPEIMSPYSRVIETDQRLTAVRYEEVSEYRELLEEMADGLGDYIDTAADLNLPQHEFIEASLGPQADALRRGNFRQAMARRLITGHFTHPDLFFGFLDRYLDTRLNAKFSPQGWLVYQDDKLTCYANKLVQVALPHSGDIDKHIIVAGDSLAMAGLAVERIWQGNTIPSEDDLRRFGSVSYIFSNTFNSKFDLLRKPALERYMPHVTDSPKWEERYKKAAFVNLALHEAVGHRMIEFDGGVAGELKSNYVIFKELLAEVYGQRAVLDLPNNLIDPRMKQAIIESSLTTFRVHVDGFIKQTDPAKKAVALAYGMAGILMLNYYQRYGGIIIDGEGHITVADMNSFLDQARRFSYVLKDTIDTERYSPGSVAKFLELNLEQPYDYLSVSLDHDGQFDNPERLAQVATA